MPAAAASFPDASRFVLTRTAAARGDFAHDVRAGLTAPQKSIPPRWFYDELGSALFDAICFLPEYYVTRAEAETLTKAASEIVAVLSHDVRLVELGSGTARKTRILLDLLTERQRDLEYVAVDIDEATLDRCGRELISEYSRLRVTGICSDFTRPSMALAPLSPHRAQTAVLFLGSTIGNLQPDEAIAMLRNLRTSLSTGDVLLLGADLRKSRTILEAAYDDALGVTAAFNRNLLLRVNRELGGHFDIDAFRHHAFYDENHGRIGMNLISLHAQRVWIDALELAVELADGEAIHTEWSYKHDASTLVSLAEASGFQVVRTWTDSRGWFADVLFVAR